MHFLKLEFHSLIAIATSSATTHCTVLKTLPLASVSVAQQSKNTLLYDSSWVFLDFTVPWEIGFVDL